MWRDDAFTQYLVVQADRELLERYVDGELRVLNELLAARLRSLGAPPEIVDGKQVQIVSAPTGRHGAPFGAPSDTIFQRGEMILALTFPGPLAERFRTFVATVARERLSLPFPAAGGHPSSQSSQFLLISVGADPVLHPVSALPSATSTPVFGTRAMAHRLIGYDELRRRGLSGRGVNVVIVDRGLNRVALAERYRQATFGEGLAVELADADGRSNGRIAPGTAPINSHGMMIARGILELAPEATVHDVPLLPPQISEPSVFASTAHATYQGLLDLVDRARAHGATDRWIIVNAWAVFDRSSEWPPGDYTRNGHLALAMQDRTNFSLEAGHPLNEIVGAVVDRGIDVVCGAGNCGQFTEASRCGITDRGEGCSIWGINSHPKVVTIGAVSVDGQWLGYSSQGPATWGGNDNLKPDVVAPSQFRDDDDAASLSTGTSASTAIAAGVMTAVRSHPMASPLNMPPGALKAALRSSAYNMFGAPNTRMGAGRIDASELCRQLFDSAERA
ncbi:MAG: S8/S53 family peptidase [Proteobacteria bacterium]|nr:S8/S53 family peptidase [Pseudomonadota bacterium]